MQKETAKMAQYSNPRGKPKDGYNAVDVTVDGY
jgi:hypothetical protein